MPIYVYSCPECEVVLEELRPRERADWPPVECPVCAGLCEREMTAATLIGNARPLGVETPVVAGRRDEIGDPTTSAAHGPGCPCCGAA